MTTLSCFCTADLLANLAVSFFSFSYEIPVKSCCTFYFTSHGNHCHSGPFVRYNFLFARSINIESFFCVLLRESQPNCTVPLSFFAAEIHEISFSSCGMFRYRISSVYDPVLNPRIHLAVLDPDPYWECGAGSWSMEVE